MDAITMPTKWHKKKKKWEKKIKYIHLIWAATLIIEQAKETSEHSITKLTRTSTQVIDIWQGLLCAAQTIEIVSNFYIQYHKHFSVTLLQWMCLIRKSNKTIFGSSACLKLNFSICLYFWLYARWVYRWIFNAIIFRYCYFFHVKKENLKIRKSVTW